MEHELELIILVLMPFALLGTMKVAEMGWELIDWIRARKHAAQA